MTIEELYATPNDGRRHELHGGVLVCEPVPGWHHGRVTARIVELLWAYVRPRTLGVVLTADAGYVLARNPDTLRGPDVSFLSWERFQTSGDVATAYPGAPDLAVEVVSPNDRPGDIRVKVQDYLHAGTRVVWVVDPETETVEVYSISDPPRVLGRDAVLDAEDVLPGFTVPLSELFAV